MSGRLRAKFAPAFSRDLKRKAGKRRWNLNELEVVIDFILENSTESMEALRRRHNMHRLSGIKYAAHQEDFDYEGLFRNRALMRCGLRTPEMELQCILGGDSHPSSYLDVNGSAQQFEEFYETYDVQEGDGMYLAPEDRIALW